MVTLDVFEVVSRSSYVPFISRKIALQSYARMDSILTTIPKRGNKNHFAIAIVKRTAECTENQGSLPCTDQLAVYLVSKVEILNVQ